MKYGYACVNPSFFMEFQQNLPQQKELLRAGVKKEHMIIEDTSLSHPDHPARSLLLRRLKAGDELVCYSQCDLGETADVRMLHMMYEPDVKAVSNRFTSLRDAVREGRLALCAYHKLTTETER